ncbi:MAG: hypothetical protein Q9185_005536 [Variospora sp. 1 TL-2023]
MVSLPTNAVAYVSTIPTLPTFDESVFPVLRDESVLPIAATVSTTTEPTFDFIHTITSRSAVSHIIQRLPTCPSLQREKPVQPSADTIISTSVAMPPRTLLSSAPMSPSGSVELPPRIAPPSDTEPASLESRPSSSTTPQPSEAAPAPSILETPWTSHAPSEADSTQPTTPSSAVLPFIPRQQSAAATKTIHKSNPLVPIIPAIPHIPLPPRPVKRTSVSITSETVGSPPPLNADHLADAAEIAKHASTDDISHHSVSEAIRATSPAKIAPKSWADLVKSRVPKPASGVKVSANKSSGMNGFQNQKVASMVEVLRDYGHSSDNDRVTFIEPRGLVNTGNMCYMNSLGRRATHSFKSETPLVDAMVMFMHEYRVIDSAESVEKLRLRLRKEELEQYGEAFIPECVYERGHQQDAEEFLGFLLEEMHDECSRAVRSTSPKMASDESAPASDVVSPISESGNPGSVVDSGWLEVGPKQKAAITRSSGTITAESPITKIFGGKLRSELRVPGMKHSVTLEPYQTLQLDIGASQVNNIVQALKGLTRSETLHGEFHSPRGAGVVATKQVTIESLPQVLVLHLKRFQYDNAGGTQKIWKRIGYPLDLEIPKEVFPQHKRGGILAHGGLPKYRLIGVAYHHGKNASGGHYTVDVRRQDDKEWIRLDDTVIRRVRSEDVAAGGTEGDPKLLAAALQQHKDSSHNHYDRFTGEGEDQAQFSNGWSQVNGTSSEEVTANMKWSGVVNGASTPQNSSGQRTPTGRLPARDNKVAYLLFYEKTKP